MLRNDFWRGIYILIQNYHAVNKKFIACIITKVYVIKSSIVEVNPLEISVNNPSIAFENTTYNEGVEADLFKYVQCAIDDSNYVEGLIFQFKCIVKNQAEDIAALSIIDFNSATYTCKFDCSNLDDFCISLKNAELQINILKRRENGDVAKSNWLEFLLLPKFKKWCENVDTNFKYDNKVKLQLPSKSLQQVDVEEYAKLYKYLKSKYAADLIQLWEKAQEKTDALKFIHEDLAIAAYLIALWQHTQTKPTAFADLGCGNGLLVHVLNQEGFCGYGYDIRARRLWSYYPSSTELVEHAINPNDLSWLPKQVDWLIGNHSDELSPWLPVIAATAHYNMRYFLLPCCAFELSGSKFQRRNSRLSTFQDFYLYARQISAKCGFNTLCDRLRIPSTKRLALIGLERTYDINSYTQQCQEVWEFVADERQLHAIVGEKEEIKLREKHEAVRNCTKLDKHILTNLVKHIFELMLEVDSVDKAHAEAWKAGGHLSLREIAQQLSSTELQHIKAQCGGIKTLLRNYHEVFEYVGLDKYGIRRPVALDTKATAHKTIKKRACFFQQYHPHGCPLTDLQCTFLH